MATCVPFQTQLSSIMEVLVKAAVMEISKLVDDKCAFLHLEISRKQSEIEMLRRKVLTTESRNAQLQRGFGEKMRHETKIPSDMLFWPTSVQWQYKDGTELIRKQALPDKTPNATETVIHSMHILITHFHVFWRCLFFSQNRKLHEPRNWREN